MSMTLWWSIDAALILVGLWMISRGWKRLMAYRKQALELSKQLVEHRTVGQAPGAGNLLASSGLLIFAAFPLGLGIVLFFLLLIWRLH